MRTALVTAGLVLLLAACGGGGTDEGPPPSVPSADALFDGDYFFHLVGGDNEFGPWGRVGWCPLTADGVDTYEYAFSGNEGGTISGPLPSREFTYAISSDRSVRWRPGSANEWRGGITADGAVLGMSLLGTDNHPMAGILVRHGTGMGPGELTGDYHFAAYGFTLPAFANESRWGSATFDGVSTGSVTWRANTEGSVSVVWVLETLGYAVSSDGELSLTPTGGPPFTGGVLEGGELAVLTGGTVEPSPPYLWVLLAASTDATVARLDGTYFVVGIELDRSTQTPANRSYTGTVTADGAGSLDPDLAMNEEGTVSGTSPLWSGYTVAADGALAVTTPSGEVWEGGVSPSGRFAVFAGDTALGMDPVLFFLFK